MAVVDMEVQACDPDIDRYGRVVCQLREAPAEDVEKFVQAVCAISGESVDWQLVSKQPTILTTGNKDIVMRVVLDNIAEYEGIAIYRATDHQ